MHQSGAHLELKIKSFTRLHPMNCDAEQRKILDLYLDLKEGSNIFLVKVSICFRMPDDYYNNVIMIYIIIP